MSKSDHIAESLVQLNFENLQGQRSQKLPEHPSWHCTTLIGKKVFIMSHRAGCYPCVLLLFHSTPLALSPLKPPLKAVKDEVRSHPTVPSGGWTDVVPLVSFCKSYAPAPDHLGGLHWTWHLSHSRVAKTRHRVPLWLLECWVQGMTSCLDMSGVLFLM